MSNYNEYGKFNYWTIKLEELPSRGIFYPKDAIIKVRSLSVLEVKYLATLQEANASEICNELFEKCTIFQNMSMYDLIAADRLYIIFWIRLNSFTMNNGFIINIPKCIKCKAPFEYNIKLTEFEFNYLSDTFEDEVYLPDIDTELKIKLPGFFDSKNISTDEIGLVAVYLDAINTFEDKYNFIANLSAYDYMILKCHINNNTCGLKDTVNIKCPHCNAEMPCQIEINDKNLFSPVNLMDILDIITKICKYSNLQITNDWSWVEVEVEQQIINKMIEAEEKEMNRQTNIARAKASSAGVHI